MGGLRVQLTNYPCPNDLTTSTANDGIPDSQKLIFPPINVNMRDFLVHYYGGGASIPNVFVKMYNYNVNPVFPYTPDDYNMPHETEWLMHYDDENDYEFYFTAVPVETFGSHRNVHIGIIRDMRENFGVFGELYVFTADDWLHMGNVSFSPAQIEAFGAMSASQGRESIVVRMYNGSGLTITEYLTLNRSELNDRHTRLWLLSRGIPTLAFYGNEGTPYLQMTEIINGVPTPPFDEIEEPTRHGFAFDGWYNTPSATDGTRFEPPNPLAPITRSVNFWARWSPIVEITSPADNPVIYIEHIAATGGLPVAWTSVPSASYRLHLWNLTANTHTPLIVDLPVSGASFNIPQSFFERANDYRLSIAVTPWGASTIWRHVNFRVSAYVEWPVPARQGTNSAFGWREFQRQDGTWSRSFHRGFDRSNARSTRIYAVMEGIVVFANDDDDGHGNRIIIYHPQAHGFRTSYSHLDTVAMGGFQVEVGQRVSAGQLIGLMGNTGNSDGNHLHFELINPSGTEVNPLAYYHAFSGRHAAGNPNPFFMNVNGAYVYNENFSWATAELYSYP
jgi:uncharacterized repeat protein (TIGR02543 family)